MSYPITVQSSLAERGIREIGGCNELVVSNDRSAFPKNLPYFLLCLIHDFRTPPKL